VATHACHRGDVVSLRARVLAFFDRTDVRFVLLVLFVILHALSMIYAWRTNQPVAYQRF